MGWLIQLPVWAAILSLLPLRAAFSACRATQPLVMVPALMALVPFVAWPDTRGRRRPRSPPAGRGQRCPIALDEAEVEEFMRTGVVKRSWFGDRKDCAPVKPSLEMAVSAWQAADRANRDREPSHLLTFFVSLRRFRQWINDDTMKKCPPRVGGYRIYQDVRLPDLDPHYTLHPLE